MDYLTDQQCYEITQRLMGTDGSMDDAICEEYETDRETLDGIMESRYYESTPNLSVGCRAPVTGGGYCCGTRLSTGRA